MFKNYYHNNLLQVQELSREYNAELILITQTISDQHWMYNNLKLINQYTIDFCKNTEVKCIDLANKISSLVICILFILRKLICRNYYRMWRMGSRSFWQEVRNQLPE